MKELDELLKKVEELSDFAHKIKLLTNLEPEEFLCQLIKYGLANEPQKVIAHLAEHWDEDMGDVLWWNFPVEEAPYCGTPLDDDFPNYKTHFTELHIPDEVEEESLYEVIIGDLYLIKKFNNRNDFCFDTSCSLCAWKKSAYQLTEAEIKAIDERYWPFAVPAEKAEV